MKVTCRANSGKNLSQEALALGDTIETQFNLEIGHEYFVYGISIWKNLMHYLISGKNENLPSWYPAELFDVSDSLLPFEWYFNHYANEVDCPLLAIWGYKELALDLKHYEGLIERESDAIKIFLMRKKEFEEYL
ncbi:MAG: hypothetical protein KAX49_20455 [Halanaerobiales bacterium]|nr:hypothetical protein [Halanaerobiales bacterium]